MGEHMTELNDDYNPRKSIEKLTANLEQPDKFAEIFCQAAGKQKAIDEVLQKVIKSLIEKDHSTREMLKVLLREVDREDLRNYVRKIGTPVWTIILLALGAILQALSRKYLG